MQNNFFSILDPKMEELMPGVFLFRGYVNEEDIFNTIVELKAETPFRHMVTPGGKKINVAGFSMGQCGWYSDRRGYRYEKIDPLSNKPWPSIPDYLTEITGQAAAKAGFEDFAPDSCFINRYKPGVRLTAHIDQDEQDFSQPIVSISVGVSAIFQIFGEKRGGKAFNIRLNGGDLLIFGGPARRLYHGVKKLEPQSHPLTGDIRYNLTFRKAL